MLSNTHTHTHTNEYMLPCHCNPLSTGRYKGDDRRQTERDTLWFKKVKLFPPLWEQLVPSWSKLATSISLLRTINVLDSVSVTFLVFMSTFITFFFSVFFSVFFTVSISASTSILFLSITILVSITTFVLIFVLYETKWWTKIPCIYFLCLLFL